MSVFSPRSSQEHADTLQALQKIAATAAELQIPFLLVGATARDMLLEHVHDMSKERRTLDVDIGVLVGSWSEYSKFTAAMTGRGFERHPHKVHNFRSEKGVVIDVVPFGGLADAKGLIAWPPDDNPVMSVTGFSDALKHCLQLEIAAGQLVNVVSLPGLAMLKLFAWNDRRYDSAKDAQDLALLLRLYGDFAKDRLFDSELELMEHHEFDMEIAGAALLGLDIGAMASDVTMTHLLAIMCGKNDDEALNDQLVRDVSRFLPGREYPNAERMFHCVLSGIEFRQKK